MRHLQTRAVHEGVYKDSSYNSVTTPIYPSSTFYWDGLGKTKGYDYTRSANPTRGAAEENVAALEGGAGAVLTATGMAAITTTLFLLKSGDHVITGNDIYGGTFRLFDSLFPRMGVNVSFIDMRTPDNVRAAMTDQTKMVWIETPSNPLLNIVDIEACATIAREAGAISVADNTFLSPVCQRPFELGVDIVMHSTTKYLNGHSDVVGGAVIGKTEELAQQVKDLANALGTTGSPFDAFLTLRGIKTLGPRMEVHQRNAKAIAEFLIDHPKVTKVYYPGLPDHPQADLIRKQQHGFGGMLSFDVTEDVDIDAFFAKLELFLLAESLGGVESLIEQPWSMSHLSMHEQARKASGITPQTIRVSTGIEHADDLIDDLKQALA